MQLGGYLVIGWIANVSAANAMPSQRCDCALVWQTTPEHPPRSSVPDLLGSAPTSEPSESIVYSSVQGAASIQSGLRTHLANATLACSCAPVHTETVVIILAALKLRPIGPTALECMANGVLDRICDTLAEFGLLTCDSRWATGFLATASPSLIQSQSLRDLVRKVFRNDAAARACHESIDFITSVDSPLPMSLQLT